MTLHSDLGAHYQMLNQALSEIFHEITESGFLLGWVRSFSFSLSGFQPLTLKPPRISATFALALLQLQIFSRDKRARLWNSLLLLKHSTMKTKKCRQSRIESKRSQGESKKIVKNVEIIYISIPISQGMVNSFSSLQKIESKHWLTQICYPTLNAGLPIR